MIYFIHLEDWIGMYDDDGKLMYQGHSIDEEHLCDMLKIECRSKWLEGYEDSHLPNTLGELGGILDQP